MASDFYKTNGSGSDQCCQSPLQLQQQLSLSDTQSENENVSNVNDNRTDENNPIETLLHELKEFKKSNAELLRIVLELTSENKQLKSKLAMRDAVSDDNKPRKVAKKLSSEVIGIGEKMDFTPSTSTKACEATVSAKDGNFLPAEGCAFKPPKKKIFQAVETNLNNVRNSIKNAKCNNFVIQQSNAKAPIKITVRDASEVSQVREALLKNHISFHEFKLNDEKNKCYLIRGLVGATAECLPEIQNELVAAGVPANSSLSLYVTGHMRANPHMNHNTILKLVVPPNFDDQILKTIKYINHVAVKFTIFKTNSVVQCKNCQRFGHSAAGCQHKHRCVKCGQDHFKDSCPRSFSKAIKLICCNCGGEHSANNLTACSYFINNFAKKTSVDPTVSQKQKSAGVSAPNSSNATFSGTIMNNNQTYASVAKGSSSSKNDGHLADS